PEAFLSYGWRIAFLVSIVLVIFGVVVRFRVAETPAFEQVQRETDLRDAAEQAAAVARAVFDGQQHRTRPFAAQREALHDAQ
ncbi:hypothetical protein PXH80_33860, partial [Mycolicibacterium smegmatis]|nr:hypothetical protein [Mycolicibacterium smegmatis]